MSTTSPSPSLPRAFWKRVEEPVMVLAAHFVITACIIVFIELTELLLGAFHLGDRTVPLLNVTLSDWMFDMDLLTASIIMLVGAVKAAIELWKAP